MKSDIRLMLENMKKTIYIFAVALLGALSCSKQMDFPTMSEEQNVPDGAKVTLEFSVPMPPETKHHGCIARI